MLLAEVDVLCMCRSRHQQQLLQQMATVHHRLKQSPILIVRCVIMQF